MSELCISFAKILSNPEMSVSSFHQELLNVFTDLARQVWVSEFYHQIQKTHGVRDSHQR